MRLHRRPAHRRRGFTLIELIVVIAIIAILASLTTAAVFSAFNKMWEVQCRNEISGMSGGMKQFESDFNISVPPPSRLYLDESGTYIPSQNYAGYAGLSASQQAALNQLATDSKAFLVKVWPRLGAQVDWNQNGTIDAPYILEGEQCLVFFLGGAHNANGEFVGFAATNPGNPMDISSPTKRKGPYFQFNVSRIKNNFLPNGFPAYLDTYTTKGGVGLPYAYFSSGKGANGYNAYTDAATLTTGLGPDCPTLGSFGPYYQPASAGQPIVYYNADTFQIISAGKNQVFGPGGSWTAANPTAIGAAGLDDLTNFTNTRLGVPQ